MILKNQTYNGNGELIHEQEIDLNQIISLDIYGTSYLTFDQVRSKMKSIIISKVNSDYSNWTNGLTSDEKIIACRWILAPYALRNSIVGDDVDKINWRKLIEETRGVVKEKLKGRERVVEEMRQFLADYLRREQISKTHIDDFYLSTESLVNSFIVTNSPNFWDWVNNTVGSLYENSGFFQKEYYTQERCDGLNSIMNGNY